MQEQQKQQEQNTPQERQKTAFTPPGTLSRMRHLTRRCERLCGGVQHLRQACLHWLRMRMPAWRRQARRLRRQGRWWGLVMISRRRTVVFPLMGPLNLNGVRLWVVCAVLALWGLVRMS